MIIFDNIIATIQKNGGISVLFSELQERLRRDKTSFVSLDYNKKTSEESVELTPRVLERYRKCLIPELYHYQSVFHSTYYRTPKDKNLPSIVTVHDFTYEKLLSGPKKFVHHSQKKHAILNSSSIICVSENTKADLLYYIPEAEKKDIHVIHNGVSEKFKPEGDRKETNKIIFVGQRGRYKNFISLVFALKSLTEFSLICVGGGPFNRSEEQLLQNTIPDRFVHLGPLTTEQLNTAYNNAYCLVYPSLYEGFGIPVIEAMKAGCPVVAVANSSIPEVAGDAAVLIHSAEAVDIAAGILAVSEARDTLIQRGYNQASKFGWEKTYKATMGVYLKYIS